MATNLSKVMELADDGQQLVIYDVNGAAAAEVASALSNATVASSVAEVAAQSATVITMVPETAHVEAVYLGGEIAPLAPHCPTQRPSNDQLPSRLVACLAGQTRASSPTQGPARC